MLKLQKAANATRQRLARASGLSANLLSETEISYSIIINLINPISLVIGLSITMVMLVRIGPQLRVS